MSKSKVAGPGAMWAYGYQIVPPQAEGRLEAIKALLEDERAMARKSARTWEGRFVHEDAITHILVVSDDPAQDGESNRRLEAALGKLQTGFVRTAPMSIATPLGPPLTTKATKAVRR